MHSSISDFSRCDLYFHAAHTHTQHTPLSFSKPLFTHSGQLSSSQQELLEVRLEGGTTSRIKHKNNSQMLEEGRSFTGFGVEKI